jgi:tellurium resistance protein TerD
MQPVSLDRPQKPSAAPGYTPQPYSQAGGQPQYGAPPAGGQYGAPPTGAPPGQYGAPPAGGQYGAPPTGSQYGAPPTGTQYGAPPTGTQYGAPPTGSQYGAPPAGTQYGAPPTGSQYGAPPTGTQYGAPPTGSQYGAPPTGAPQAGQYGQPGMQQGQYGAPPAGPYGQPGMGQPGMQPGMQQPYGQQPVLGRPPGAPGVISLVKGQNMSLSKAAPNLRHARIGLGWDVRQSPGEPFDLDTSIFLLNGAGKVRMPQDFIFYNNKQSIDGSVVHHGDNLTGAGEGDDEQMSVDLTRVPPDVQRVVIICSIYEAEQRRQNFGMVQRAFIRIVDQDNNQEVVRYDLTEEACMASIMIFGELYRYGQEWKFKALGTPVQGGLRALGTEYGIALG